MLFEISELFMIKKFEGDLSEITKKNLNIYINTSSRYVCLQNFAIYHSKICIFYHY